MDEKLKATDKMGDWVKDFQDSDAPQFKGKSKEKKRQMAVAAKLGAERDAGMREAAELDEAFGQGQQVNGKNIEAAMRKALKNKENYKSGKVLWNFIDADVYMDIKPSRGQVDSFYKMFDRVADKLSKEMKLEEAVELDEASVTPGDLKAQAEGKKAARKGQKYNENPYEKGSSRHLQWSKGHNAARAGMKEEVEQIDELSKDALRSYKYKAQMSEPEDMRQYKNRSKGIERADKKLKEAAGYKATSEKSQFGGHRAHLKNPDGKTSYMGGASYKKPEHAKGEAQAYHDAYFGGPGRANERAADRAVAAYRAKHKEHMHTKNESVEQLDELSPNTLHRYIKKAAGNMGMHAVDHGKYGDEQKDKQSLNKAKKRLSGITSASGRLADKANQANESDKSWAMAQEKEKEKRLTSKDKDKLDKVRAMMAKEKGMKESVDLDEAVGTAAKYAGKSGFMGGKYTSSDRMMDMKNFSAIRDKRAAQRDAEHKKQDPKHAAAGYAKHMVDTDKAKKKAAARGVDASHLNWKHTNGVKRGKLPEEFELDEQTQYNLVEAYLLENNIDVDSLTEEELNEIIGKVIGGAFKAAAKTAVGAGRLIKKAANRMSTSGKADAAEKKAAAAEKKNRDRERIKKAQERLRAAQAAARS